jgi:pyroglutamyl-peptidase
MKPVLLTGFEPFGGDTRNPSQEIAGKLDGVVLGRRRVVGRVLPCVFGDSITTLERLIRQERPALVVCLGMAGGRADITPERVAINLDDARIPDNAGRAPVDRPVVKNGPAAYFSTLPIKAIVAGLKERDVPASVSPTAGNFVCNHVFYGLMHLLKGQRSVRGGFIHVPYLPDQARPGEPSLALEVMVEAIAFAVELSLRTKRDLRTTGGELH